jgi:regulator of protease activity HflC (stomatin/prohibitin superfamily)
MFNPLPMILFFLFAAAGWFVIHPSLGSSAVAWYAMWLVASLFISSFFRIAAQWEKALVFRFGKFSAVKGPGIFTVIPGVESARLVDTRILTLDIPRQEAITKDNVPVSLDGVIFLRVSDPADAVIRVQNYQHAIRQYAQTALRDVVGAATLDQILADREALGHKIEQMVETEIQGWGLEVAAIRIQDIVLPEDLKRVMARQASAEREKRANITKSEGDREAAENLAAAATTMATAPGALQLRTLQTLDSLGSSAANTVVMAVPVDVMNAFQAVPELAKALYPVKKAEEKPIEEKPTLSEGFMLTKPPKVVDQAEGDQQVQA